MSVKHVKDYYLKIAEDYKEMRTTLDLLESVVTDSTASAALSNIENIRQQVNALKENYMRISYIVYLLNMPNKEEKKRKYIRQERKALDKIPEKDRLNGVLEEDKKVLDTLIGLTKN